MLAALVSGEAAEAFERQPAAASVERVMAVLRRIYEPQGVQVPAPVQVQSAAMYPTVPLVATGAIMRQH